MDLPFKAHSHNVTHLKYLCNAYQQFIPTAGVKCRVVAVKGEPVGGMRVGRYAALLTIIL